MMYPVPPEIPNSDDGVLALLIVCQKYDMSTVQSSIRAEASLKGLLSPTGADSFRLFAIASREELIPEMEVAALRTLDYPMTFEFLGDILELFEPWALRKLARFHQYCRVSLVSCLRILWDRGTTRWGGCPKRGEPPAPSIPLPHYAWPLPGWLNQIFSTRIFKLSTFEHPLRSSFREEYLVALQAHVREDDCSVCMKIHALHGEGFCTEVENRLAQAWDIHYLSRDELPRVRAYTLSRKDP